MSKNHSIPLNQIYRIELVAIGISAVVIIGVVIFKAAVLIKQPSLPPSVNIQQLDLQKAINTVSGATAN